MYSEPGAGRYEGAARQGLVFSAGNQGATTFTMFTNNTATGLVLSNPTGSGRLLSVLGVSFQKVAAASAQIENLGLSVGTGAVTHTTPLTVASTNVGKTVTTGVGLCDAAATIVAGVYAMPLFTPSASATATTAIPPISFVDIGGLFVVSPGSFIQLAAGFTNTVSGTAAFFWREIEI